MYIKKQALFSTSKYFGRNTRFYGTFHILLIIKHLQDFEFYSVQKVNTFHQRIPFIALRYTLYHDAINPLSHRDKGLIATQYTLYRKITPCKSLRNRQKTRFSCSISSVIRDKLFDQKS